MDITCKDYLLLVSSGLFSLWSGLVVARVFQFTTIRADAWQHVIDMECDVSDSQPEHPWVNHRLKSPVMRFAQAGHHAARNRLDVITNAIVSALDAGQKAAAQTGKNVDLRSKREIWTKDILALQPSWIVILFGAFRKI